MGCLRESANVVKGRFLDIVLAILFMFFMEQSITYMIQLVFSFIPFNPASELLQRFFMTFFDFIFINATTLLYLNRKYMNEGFAEETFVE